MAIARQPPMCPFCNAPLAKAIHKKGMNGFVGDTFLRWEDTNHHCTEYDAQVNKIKSSINRVSLKDLFKK